jgi:DNA-binding NarL/FixJ family response regulator
MKNILLIDDEPEFIQPVLQREGYRVKLALDGQEGLLMIADPSAPPDLVILDLNLPYVNGLSILARTRNDNRYRHVPVMILSVLHQDEIAVRALEGGADIFLTKPVSPMRLAASVAAVLRRAEEAHSVPEASPCQWAGRRLTQRETGILELLIKGYTNQQIADVLFISEVTVRNHLANIFRKLGVHNRTQAAWYVQQMKLIG